MAAQLIPLTSNPNQQQAITVTVNGQTVSLQLFIYFNEMAQFWLMDIYSQSGTVMLASLPLITGAYPAANILGPYQYLQIGSAYVINAGSAQNDFPNSTQLGSAFYLLWDDSTNNLPNIV